MPIRSATRELKMALRDDIKKAQAELSLRPGPFRGQIDSALVRDRTASMRKVP